MPPESKTAKCKRAAQINSRLQNEYPNAATALHWRNPFELLVATILSAQCTDEVVNKVTSDLFSKYPRPEDYAAAPLEQLEQDVYSTGFYRRKAKSIKQMAQAVLGEFGGEVPDNIEEMLKLSGVARKTANVVLQEAIRPEGPFEGIVVDTHVARIAYRLGLTKEHNPDKIERDLMALLPDRAWRQFANGLILLGRQYCTARKPDHKLCPLADICPKKELNHRAPQA